MHSLPLQKWFIHNQRDLPFRHTKDPYLIWVSEVMLQQTQVDTMIPFYERFIRRYPTIQTLANAELESVLTMVQGIGYYRRFRLLHQGARYIVQHHHGVFPKDYDSVRQIPSIGKYTAGAIMSIAFNQPYAATDGNVLRVLSRFYHFSEDISLKKSVQFLEDKNQNIVMQGPPSVITPALMELGALICRPKQPQCEICPLQSQCLSFAKQTVDTIPVKAQKKKPKILHWTTFVIIYKNKILLQKNREQLLQDMYVLPQTQDKNTEDFIKNLLLKNYKVKNLQAFTHQFTHQIWHMHPQQINIKKEMNIAGMIWVDLQALGSLPIPEAHKKIIRTLRS